MRRLLVAVALGSSVVAGAGTALAAAPTRAPGRSHSYRIVLRYSGNEYEDAQNHVLNGTDATNCPPSREVSSVKAKCWTWRANHLGHGTYTQSDVSFQPDNITWNFTLKDSRGDMLKGNAHGAGVDPDPTPPHTVGHVNRFPGETYTFTEGTGRFRGVSGALTGAGQSMVLSVDANTGIAHKKGTDTSTGTLTFPRKL
jgi:hypothetical protein